MADDVQAQLDAPQQVHKGEVTLLGGDVRKADTQMLISTNAVDSYPEDPYQSFYTQTSAGAGNVVQIIEPTFKPGVLKAVCSQNNILPQCVEAMEVNIDGTGFTIEKDEEDTEDKGEQKMLKDFFDNPYPGKSMIGIRRELRQDLEQTGSGYLEVARNASDEVTLLNYLDACEMRLVRLDEPVFVEKVIRRGGKDVKVKLRVRERRFVQLVNGKKTFFKEFGASRDIDRDTGKWAEPGQRLGLQKRGSEVIHFIVNKEAKTPYGSPRWINQLPSVLGSRKAEEFNLEFFDSGGLPPVLVIVQGGYLATDVKDSLKAHLNGKGSAHRAAIVEAISASGSLDSAGTVKVTVERFGTERQQDSMFQNYDKNCEEHVRVAFRLPPLFIGRAQDYNFATAQTGYMVAEAQVFQPERQEFDERMWELCKALGAKSYFYKSKPLTIKDAATMVSALQLVVTNKIANGEGAIQEINQLTGMSLEYQDPPDPVQNAIDIANGTQPQNQPGGTQPPKPGQKTAPGPQRSPSSGTAKDPNAPGGQKGQLRVVKSEDDIAGLTRIIKLADDWTTVLGLRGPNPYSEGEVAVIKAEVNALEGPDQKLFNEIIATRSLVDADHAGLAELCGHAVLKMMEAH